MHPADELHVLRQEMGRLKRRETALRRYFLEGSNVSERRGERWEVTLETQRSVVLDTTKLPAGIIDDPHYWMTRLTHRVCLREIAMTPPSATAAWRPSPAAAAGRSRVPEPQAKAATPQPQAEATWPLIDLEDGTA